VKVLKVYIVDSGLFYCFLRYRFLKVSVLLSVMMVCMSVLSVGLLFGMSVVCTVSSSSCLVVLCWMVWCMWVIMSFRW